MIFPAFDQLLAFTHDHPLLLAAFITVLLAIIANEAHGRLTGGPRASVADAVRLINDRQALVVDVRSARDYKKSHLLGALNIPAANLKERADQLGKDLERPVIVYCNLGNASLEAAKVLRGMGHKEVYSLHGGINGWENSNLPVTTK
ncbi:MAG: rhodanese-like domain-containing protein [Nevskiaceae bacterium]|nr:MAG: rhodanese-like domain-containing protein [Nevskiaceae bacterium]TBR73081.1 MAG: rhodanese-like domain-containing protein [Nevskiaceae bacterium]